MASPEDGCGAESLRDEQGRASAALPIRGSRSVLVGLVGPVVMVALFRLTSVVVMAFAPLQQLLLQDPSGNGGGMVENQSCRHSWPW